MVGKCSNTFDQLLLYSKILVSRNNLEVLLNLPFQIVIYHPILCNNCAPRSWSHKEYSFYFPAHSVFTFDEF